MVLADLQALGLSALASRVYLALLEKSDWASGYEIAKDLGVARANVYDALRFLVQAGFAQQRHASAGTQYVGVSFGSVATRQTRQLEARITRLQQALPQVQNHPNIWQGSGWNSFREQVEGLVRHARSEIRIGTSVTPIQQLGDLISLKTTPSVVISFGCWEGCPLDKGCGVCHPPIRLIRPWTREPACLVVADHRVAVASWGSIENPTVFATDFPAIVAGWNALVESPAP